jgi:hypothetical protein
MMSTLRSSISIDSTEAYWRGRSISDAPAAVHRYRRAVEKVLSNIAAKETGRWVLGADIRKPVTIVPGTPQHTGSLAENPLDATQEDARERTCRIVNGSAAGSPAPSGQFGTGIGSAVTIFFTPLDWVNKVRPGERQDEVLLHELVHTFRKATGTQACRPWGSLMDTEEEVMCIGITNMYASEWHRPLRDHHHAFTALSNPTKWIQQNAAPFLRLWFEQKSLCDRIAKEKAIPFNPFRDLSPGP